LEGLSSKQKRLESQNRQFFVVVFVVVVSVSQIVFFDQDDPFVVVLFEGIIVCFVVVFYGSFVLYLGLGFAPHTKYGSLIPAFWKRLTRASSPVGSKAC